jgi:hypothetical protein
MDTESTDRDNRDAASSQADTETAGAIVAVFAAPDQLTAEMIRVILESQGIAAVIGERVTDAYAPLLQIAEGYWGEVCVPVEQEAEARAVLADVEEGVYRVSEEELTRAATESTHPGV